MGCTTVFKFDQKTNVIYTTGKLTHPYPTLMRVKLSQTYQKMLISNSINEKKRVFLESNAHWSRSYSKLKLISGKQHKTNTHLSCRPDIIEKTACSEIFRPEIDLNFLEDVNALIGNRSPCYWSSINNIQTLQGVSSMRRIE